MEQSILTSTKNILGLAEHYTAFDHTVIVHINSTFSILQQLGVGPDGGFMIEDKEAVWSDFLSGNNWMNLVRTYMHLKVRSLFDPPSASYMIAATEKQISEAEWRLTVFRDEGLT